MEEKLKLKHYVGYTSCDFANNLAFCVMGTYLSAYCLDVLHIQGWVVTLILVLARVWDGINDPIMGFLVQKKKPGKYGKYRPFIIWGGYPLALSAVLVFLRLTENLTFNTVWVACAYILYGMLYTVLLVPYGSLATVMTSLENERSNLSICRALGGGAGNLPTILFPIFVMTAGADGQQMDPEKLVIGMVIVAVSMILLYTLSFKWTKESRLVEISEERVKITSTLKDIIRDRAFITMSLIGCLLIAVQMYISSANVYLFKDYYGKSGFGTIYLAVSYVPMAIFLPFANKIIKSVGKKEICTVGFAVSAVAAFICFFVKLTNIWLYIAFAFIINTGIAFITLEIWAMCGDIIDHQELKTGKREEAANYAVFTFLRKIGQAVAGMVPMLIGLTGYNDLTVGNQTLEVKNGIYNVSTLGPAVMFTLMFILILLYPLDRKKTQGMYESLKRIREKKLDVAENGEKI